ncbi:MAG: phage tail assembly protein [Sporomusaceae bacterium]|nr:phage tail assembly protein [Sporomusaceae bacterium]
MNIKFGKTHTFEGKEYKELKIDLDGLTGKDLVDASREARLLGDAGQVQEFSAVYLAVVSAKAAKVPVDMILALPAKDFTAVKTAVQNFLLG